MRGYLQEGGEFFYKKDYKKTPNGYFDHWGLNL